MDFIDSQLATEIERRRTFAIISHPDAGKTTLTEKLLLFGGAIREAGSVKGKSTKKYATSDWMGIEKKRGISVTSTALQFEYENYKINILDTPGHEDFSEDTYRTLIAADCAVMLIDAAKGIETQTLKLFQVCRMRQVPIITFINKLDREGREPLDLLKQIEDVLHINTYPMNWPVSMGADLRGVFNRSSHTFESYDGREITDELQQQLMDDISLLDVAGETMDSEKVWDGELTPVFFGSAITNFGVETFLKEFIKLAPPPRPRKTKQGFVAPLDTEFSGFVFKIQANMNPAHRDRIAFVRICSGKFERGMSVQHVRTNKSIHLSQSQQFFAQDRTTVDIAFPGDIIGIYDPGIFHIGDTLSETDTIEFEPLPQFSPEYFARITVKDTLKYKQFHKGLQQLAEEGAVQVFHMVSRTEDIVLGVVGELQFEVFEYRMKAEYGTDITKHVLPYQFARWISATSLPTLQYDRSSCLLVTDQYAKHALLFPDEYTMQWAINKNPKIVLHPTSFALDASSDD